MKQIGLGTDQHQLRFGQERLDFLKEIHLFFIGRTARFTFVHEEQHQGTDVLEGGNGLHFDVVALLHRSVKQPRCIHHLVLKTAMGEVANVNLFGGERVVVHFHFPVLRAEMNADLPTLGARRPQYTAKLDQP